LTEIADLGIISHRLHNVKNQNGKVIKGGGKDLRISNAE
jgi:hypothetical protein